MPKSVNWLARLAILANGLLDWLHCSCDQPICHNLIPAMAKDFA